MELLYGPRISVVCSFAMGQVNSVNPITKNPVLEETKDIFKQVKEFR